MAIVETDAEIMQPSESSKSREIFNKVPDQSIDKDTYVCFLAKNNWSKKHECPKIKKWNDLTA